MGTGSNDVVTVEYTVLKLAQAGTVEVTRFSIYRDAGCGNSTEVKTAAVGMGDCGMAEARTVEWWDRVCMYIECALPPIRAGNSAAASFSSRISHLRKLARPTAKIPVITPSSAEQVPMAGRQHPNHPIHYLLIFY